jgi:hypothetical protein
VPTSLGGLLYLINVMLYLELPKRPGPGLDLAAQVGPWGVLEALALGILDTLPEAAATWSRWARDEVWTQLALLDGRAPGQRPGGGPAGPRQYELPAAWRPGDGTDAVLWSRRRGRVRWWSTHGYLISDLPDAADASIGPRRLRRPHSSAPVHHFSDEVAGRVTSLRFWLARVVPYLRFRLTSALGATAPDTAADAALRELLLRAGRLHVTSTHVDLVMGLESVSGAVRKAGLDRDPGWQSPYGRVIKFHYE